MAKMHQTTVRFSADLWEELETECFALGVSIAQYLREAAVARVAYSAARRGDVVYAAALEEAIHTRAGSARERALTEMEPTEAVLAQSKLARERSRQLRVKSERARVQRART